MYLAILDFEATCWKENNNHEIIEFPTVIVDVETRKVVAQIQMFVKPKNNPILSDFCKELTGIDQKQVDEGMTLDRALSMHNRFIADYKDFMFVTCGDWDLKTMLPMDLKSHKIDSPHIYNKWINIKKAFSKLYNDNGKYGMPGMLHKLDLKLLGRHHSGIDDCKNIARIAIKMLKNGWVPEITSRL